VADASDAPASWESHEQHVAGLYRLLGYKVTHNINADGQQTDLLCEKAIPGAGDVRLYVDCKHSITGRNSVSKDQVTQFIYNFRALQQARKLTAGVLVSNVKFTQFASAAAAPHHDIILKTTDQLHSDIFSLPPYLHSSILAYDAENTFGDYVSIKGKRLDTLTISATGLAIA
jgi:hypothetical protein